MNPIDWFRRGDGFDWPRIVLIVLLLAVIGTIGVATAVSTAPFSPYGATWEGTSEFRTHIEDTEDRELEIVTSSSGYDDLEAADSAAFVFAPREGYSAADIDHIVDFLDRGGTLILLDSSGLHANELLSGLDAEARLDGQILQDDRHYAQGPLMPIATEILNHSKTLGVEQVTLNFATAVQPGDASLLVNTSAFAYLGEPDDEIDDDTELTSYPVATLESIGDGELVVVGDPSIAINAMFGEPDNRPFLDAVAGEAGTVAFDTSHGPDVPPTQLVLLWLEDTPLAQAILGLGLVFAVAIIGERGLRLRGRAVDDSPDFPEMTAEERIAYLANEHPAWDRQHIERIVGAFNRDDTEAGGNSDE